MRWREIISEQVVVKDRAVSDVDGQMRDLIIVKNPTRSQTEALLQRSVEGELRGFVDDFQGTGVVYVWDAYVADHAGADEALRKIGIVAPFPRFVMKASDLGNGILMVYEDAQVDWSKVPTTHLERIYGRKPRFVRT